MKINNTPFFNDYRASYSVKEARKILGKGSKQLNDAQIQDIICTLTLLARKHMCYNGSKKALGDKNG